VSTLLYLQIFITLLGVFGFIWDWLDDFEAEVWEIAFDGVVPACNADGTPGIAYGPMIWVQH
jgi:hypothetical protein